MYPWEVLGVPDSFKGLAAAGGGGKDAGGEPGEAAAGGTTTEAVAEITAAEAAAVVEENLEGSGVGRFGFTGRSFPVKGRKTSGAAATALSGGGPAWCCRARS